MLELLWHRHSESLLRHSACHTSQRSCVMGTQKRNGGKNGCHRPHAGCKEPCERRRKRDPPDIELPPWIEPLQFPTIHAANIAIPWIVDEEIVPQHHSVRPQHSRHLGGNSCPDRRIKD